MRSRDAEDLANDTIATAWQQRRTAERTPFGARVGLGIISALAVAFFLAFLVHPAGPRDGAAVGIAALVLLVIFGGMLYASLRHNNARGHTGSLDPLEALRDTPWWRSPVLLGPVGWSVVIFGLMFGVFDHWAGIVVIAVLVGVATIWYSPTLEIQDPIYGDDPEVPPHLSDDARAAFEQGELAPAVLELLALQMHLGERRISWCARVLDTDEADIRDRIARSGRWLELPATEVHDLWTARWVRPTKAGREVLASP